MFQKDPLLNLSHSSHSPHNIIPSLIPGKCEILDVGCNTGIIGKKLILEKGATVDGVDINFEALAIAQSGYRKTYQRDLYKPSLKIDPVKYDFILFSDILEHLPRPDLLIKDSAKYLKDTGRLIISLPNMARLEVRLKLLLGNFDYSPGILSEDHLRFFTRRSAIKLIEGCGFAVEKIVPTGLGHMIKLLPTLTAFQFIFVCRRR